MSDNKRAFKGIWIPSKVWLDDELKIMEKVFLVEIDSLDNEKGCFASNGYFSKFFKITPQRCSQIINSLIKKEYITAKYEYEGKEVKQRVLNIFDRGIKESLRGYKENLPGYKENVKDNNTSNNTSNNTLNKDKEISTDMKEIYTIWLRYGLIKHSSKTLLNNIKSKHYKLIKDYGKDEVINSVKNYATVLNNNKYYWTHKFSFWDFIGRGLNKFLDECQPLTNYIKSKPDLKLVDEDPLSEYEDFTPYKSKEA